MTLVAALVLLQAPAAAAEFFPLVPGSRRIYEEKGDGKATLIDEVGTKPAQFGGAEAVAVVQKNQFNQPLTTTYYRVEGPTVLLVGYAEERTTTPKSADGTIDLTGRGQKRTVLLELTPAMPVFKYEGRETSWAYGEIPLLKAFNDDQPIKTDPTAIKGTAKPGKPRTILGRTVETIDVRAEVELGLGKLAEKIVETSTYGRGIGLIESVRKTTGGGKRGRETRTTLVGIEDAKP